MAAKIFVVDKEILNTIRATIQVFLYKNGCFIKVEYFELYNHTVLKPAVIKSPLSSSVVWSTRFSHWPQWWHKEVQVDFYSYITL